MKNLIKVDQHYFELIENYRECFNEEQFIARYSDILDKYDYIVGDYGYDQLRLKGFYKDSNKKQTNKRFSNIQDYIFEIVTLVVLTLVLRHLSKQEVKKLIEEVHPSDVIDDDNKLQDVKIKPTIQDTEH